MKIAVTYEDNNVFQHFGRTKHFKVYDVKDQKVISSEIMDTNGVGHGALAGLLAVNGIDVLICGKLGKGAQMALEDAGIQLTAGASGNTDTVVEKYLHGELTSEQGQGSCDHHDHTHSCDGQACHNH